MLRASPVLLEERGGGVPAPLAKELTKVTTPVSLLLMMLVVALLSVNARFPSPFFVGYAQLAAVGSLALGVIAFAMGVTWLVRSRPESRRAALYLGLLAAGVLLLHLYIVNSPATSTPGTLSGTVGTAFHDSDLQVSSFFSGSQLRVSIIDAGSSSDSHAVAQVSVFLDNKALPSSVLSPLPTFTNPLEPTSTSSLGYGSESTATWSVSATPASVLRVDYSYLTCFHVPNVNDTRAVYGCVMDETYYVPSALGLLSGNQCAPYADSCNVEHPPLAKAFIAGGIAVFGLNDLGWRISSVVLGTLSIPLLFVLAYSVTGNRRLSYFATLIFAADTLFFVHSSAAVIDVPAVFFSLLGFILYFRRASFWKVDNYIASGVFFGLAALSKETALFALAAAASYELLFGNGIPRAKLYRLLGIMAPAVLVFVGVVQLYDLLFASSALPWFYRHIGFMLSYGSGLKGGGWTGALFGKYITPLDWLIAYQPIGYLVVKVSSSTLTYVSVGYYGIASLVVVWMVFIWIPLAAARLVKGRRAGTPLSADDRFGVFLTVWFLWSYVPYIVLWLFGRVTYPFYIVPAIPALAAGAAYFLTREWFPSKMAIVYLVAAFGIFFLYFPVKDFLPVAVRVWLGR